jgi:hypothetical protein
MVPPGSSAGSSSVSSGATAPAAYHRRLNLAPTEGLRDWRTELKREGVEVFEFIAGELLTRLGYPLAAPGKPVQ